MAEYEISDEELKRIVSIDCRIYPPMDCDDPFDGPSGPELLNLIRQTEIPGYQPEVDEEGVFYVLGNGKKYKLVAVDLDGKATDIFSREHTRTFDEVVLMDEEGHFLGIEKEEEVKPLVEVLKQRFEETYDINTKELFPDEDEDISPDDVD
jgi:hypothetical protein